MSRVLAVIFALFLSTEAAAEQRPAQIGRLAGISGAVAVHGDADPSASEAIVNLPLTSGNRVATPPRAHATIDIAAGRFYLDGDSALTIGTLGPGTTAVKLEQGAVILHILPGGAGQVFRIATPRGVLRADHPGSFEVELTHGGVVIASALEGGAQFNETTVLPPRTRATMAPGAAPLLEAAAEDDFSRRVAIEVEASGQSKLEAPQYISPQITGFQELQRRGLWIMTEKYGPVWEPQVMSDWVPFRDGRWVDIKPRGRTWIDNAPWGFAPSHYGEWTKVNSRWVWIPGDAAFSPVRLPPAARVLGTEGQDRQGVGGWVSLGPEEQISTSPVTVHNVRVIRQDPPKVVNVTTVNNTTHVTNVVKEDRRPAVVLIPAYPPVPPPSPPPGVMTPGSNRTGLGASGTPIQRGVPFPGQR